MCEFTDGVNNTLKRPDCNKVLPHGVPNLIYESPEDFGALDFKVTVTQDAIDHVRNLYVKTDHLVFDLVPQPLNNFIVVTMTWAVLQSPATAIRSLTDAADLDEGALPLLDNQRDLFFHEDIDGTYYMGGVHGGQGLDMSDHRWLDELAELDEPAAHLLPAAPIIEEGGLVVTEFSDEDDDNDNDEMYEW
ncbi:hypothetical protein BDR03DRAFT_1004991 [Suillus americanus]|nr:hypothetical protein BDR03DRAFT_1004991 [Suillus americanus]